MNWHVCDIYKCYLHLAYEGSTSLMAWTGCQGLRSAIKHTLRSWSSDSDLHLMSADREIRTKPKIPSGNISRYKNSFSGEAIGPEFLIILV